MGWYWEAARPSNHLGRFWKPLHPRSFACSHLFALLIVVESARDHFDRIFFAELFAFPEIRFRVSAVRISCYACRAALLEVLRLMEGTLVPVACLQADSKPCAQAANCRTLPLWEGLEKTVRDYLSGYTVQDLMCPEDGAEEKP